MEEMVAPPVNLAPTEVEAFMVTVQADVPLHPPDHPANVALEAGAGVRVTTVPAE
jgi:hypothetical protein